MSSGKIENQLLDAIETVVNNAVAKANYDRTVQAVIVRCENEASGKYTVKYQDSLMYAYSPDLNSIYPNGTPVYVLIPGNDTGLNKQIIGSVSRIGEDYLDNINEENAYEYNVLKIQTVLVYAHIQMVDKLLFYMIKSLALIELD